MHRSISAPIAAYSIAELAVLAWLVFGAVAIALIPQARGTLDSVGWLPFWLVVAPLLDLALLHRHRLWSTSRAFLVRARRRRQPARQARRTYRRRLNVSLGAAPPRMA